MLVLLLLLLLLTAGLALAAVFWWLGARRARGRSRRWARVAQRRAPARRADGDQGPLLQHIDRQIECLLTERHRLQLLISRGERLRGMLRSSPQFRSRVPTVERVLRHLGDKAAALDTLIGRYHQHRENLVILGEAEAFGREFEAYEEGNSLADPFGGFRLATDELDEETARLMAIAEAEDELTLLLRTQR